MAWVRFGLYRSKLETEFLIDVTKRTSDAFRGFNEACLSLPLIVVEE